MKTCIAPRLAGLVDRMKPRLLDLFCGDGGASMGYHLAGFDVVGVDIVNRPRYPFEFVKADATTYPLDGFDVVTGGPPCHDHSALAGQSGLDGTGWMLQHTIARFRASGLPYVVENVIGADMPGALVLCGTEFNLRSGRHWLKRHRQFASNVFLLGAGGCNCYGKPIGGVYGNGGESKGRGYKFNNADRREAMGIDWMTRASLSQAIPPAYTQFIGEQLLAHIQAEVAA